MLKKARVAHLVFICDKSVRWVNARTVIAPALGVQWGCFEFRQGQEILDGNLSDLREKMQQYQHCALQENHYADNYIPTLSHIIYLCMNL